MEKLQKLSNGKIPRRIFLSFVLLAAVYLCYCFPLTGDDLFFKGISFRGPADALNYGLTFGNGRILGNIGIVYLVHNDLLRVLVKALCLFGIVYFSGKLCNIRSITGYSIITLIIFGVSAPVFSEAISWTAGFQNYVTPVCLTLICLNIIKYLYENSPRKHLPVRVLLYVLLCIIAFASQLYAENSTVFQCILAVTLVIGMKKASKKFHFPSILYTIFSIAGAAVMFLVPQIYDVTDKMYGYRDTAHGITGLISTAVQNIRVLSDIMILNYTLFFFLSAACLLYIRQCNVPWINKWKKSFQIVLILLPVYVLFRSLLIDNWAMPNFYIKIAFDFLLLICYFAIVFAVILSFPKSREKSYLIIGYLSGFVATAPLLAVSPVGARLIFLPYICFMVFVLYLIKTLRSQRLLELPATRNKAAGKASAAVCLALFMALGLCFTNVRYVDTLRTSYIEEKMEQHAKEITIPLLPSNFLIHNDAITRNTYDRYYYYETPGDIKFHVIDYSIWLEDYKRKG